MEFYRKYMHIGYSNPSVADGWKPIVKKALIDIERAMWPKYLPMFLKRWIHYLATGNSVVRVKFKLFHKLRQRLTKGQIITDVKEKYATLRIYYHGGDEIDHIVSEAEKECDKTCELCGSKQDVSIYGKAWITTMCKACQIKAETEKLKTN